MALSGIAGRTAVKRFAHNPVRPENCRIDDYKVGVSATDRFGVLQSMLLDQLAGPHTPGIALREAWTSRKVAGVLSFCGGVRIVASNGAPVEAIGVPSAPSGNEDDSSAKTGISAIIDKTAF